MLAPQRRWQPRNYTSNQTEVDCQKCDASRYHRRETSKLHRNELLAILLADVVNGADIRMIQCGCGLFLAAAQQSRGAFRQKAGI